MASSGGRPCSVCSLPTSKLLELERAVHGRTVRVSQLALIHQVSTDAIYRHVRSHPPMEARVETPESATPIVVADLVERLVEVADDARRARHLASLNNHALSLSRAAEAEMRAVGMLLDRLGVDNTEAVQELRTAEALVQAVAGVSRTHPGIGRELGRELRMLGLKEAALTFENFAAFAESKLREHEVSS